MVEMQRFTPGARRVLELAQAEAEQMNHRSLEPEHVLLGLIQEGQGTAARTLASLNLRADPVRMAIRANPYPRREAGAKLDLSVGVKRALERAVEHARSRQQDSVDTEHLLLALIDTWTGIDRLLDQFSISLEGIRQKTLNAIGGGAPPPAMSRPSEPRPAASMQPPMSRPAARPSGGSGGGLVVVLVIVALILLAVVGYLVYTLVL